MRALNIAHRGASKDAPENTLAAFRLGLEQGCDAFELDVQLSKDHQVMVCHDDTLQRTTGVAGRLIDKDAAFIRECDAGSWKSEQYRGEKIPFLSEVLELVPADKMLNIEIKMIPEYYGHMENALLTLLRDNGRLDNTVISSFDHDILVTVARLEPRLRIGLLYAQPLYQPEEYAASFPVPVYSLHPHYGLLNEENVARAKARGLVLYPWTVNREEDMKRMIGLGVDGIITDVPAVAKTVW